jgi:hypothetical protein
VAAGAGARPARALDEARFPVTEAEIAGYYRPR